MKRGLDLATEFGFHPSFACCDPGFVRLGAALQCVHRVVPQPIYRLMFSNGMAFGFTPKRYALDAYRTLLQSGVPGAPVMIAGLDVDVSELMADAVDAGIHIRIGLEDAPLFNRNTNVQLVEAADAKIQRPTDRKSNRLNSSHYCASRRPSSA